MKRLGVFICHCGMNIAGTVDVKSQGMNPYLCEIANIREQCSWVHQKEKEEATQKAEEIIKATLQKVRKNEMLEAIAVAINRRVLVVGGGIAGITASLDLAEGGYEVILLEREAALGGHMAQLSRTFPDLDPASSGLLSKASEVEKHPKIHLHCYSELEDVKGYIGNFDLVIRKKGTSVDGGKCTGCGLCTEYCPAEYVSEFERGMGMRKAIDTLYPSSVPNKPVIHREHCRYFLEGSCQLCEEVGPEKPITSKR